MAEMETQSCNLCNIAPKTLKRCARCKLVYYCSREHQVQDWSIHKSSCQPFAASEKLKKHDPDKHELDHHVNTEISESNKLNVNALDKANKVESTFKRNINQLEDSKNSGIDFDSRPYKETIFDQPVSCDPFILSEFSAKQLKDHGLCVIDNILPVDKCKLVHNDVLKLCDCEKLQYGKLAGGKTSGVDADKIVNSSIRNDKIFWIEGIEEDIKKYPNICDLIGEVMDIVVAGLNAHFDEFQLSGRTKAMIACYPGDGAAYKRHVDNPNKDGRLVTCIVYLNENWDVKTQGGFLRIFPKSKNGDFVDVEPKFNRMILFWSDSRNPHEVHPAYSNRYAITIWYYEREERAKAKNELIEKEAERVRGEIKLMNLKVKKMEMETVERQIEAESIKAMNLLSESELEAICEIVGNNPDPRGVLTGLGIASSIQDLLIKEMNKRKGLR